MTFLPNLVVLERRAVSDVSVTKAHAGARYSRALSGRIVTVPEVGGLHHRYLRGRSPVLGAIVRVERARRVGLQAHGVDAEHRPHTGPVGGTAVLRTPTPPPGTEPQSNALTN